MRTGKQTWQQISEIEATAVLLGACCSECHALKGRRVNAVTCSTETKLNWGHGWSLLKIRRNYSGFVHGTITTWVYILFARRLTEGKVCQLQVHCYVPGDLVLNSWGSTCLDSPLHHGLDLARWQVLTPRADEIISRDEEISRSTDEGQEQSYQELPDYQSIVAITIILYMYVHQNSLPIADTLTPKL